MVRRCKSFSVFKTNLTYLENSLVDWPMNIAMRTIEHVIPNCSYGNHRWHKCVVNRDELFFFFIHGNRTLDRTVLFPRPLRHNLCYVLLYHLVGAYGCCMATILIFQSTNIGLPVSRSFWLSSRLIPTIESDLTLPLLSYSYCYPLVW